MKNKIIKILILSALLLQVCSCTKTVYVDASTGKEITNVRKHTIDDFFNRDVVCRGLGSAFIVRDKNTDCLYYEYYSCAYPIMKPDGTVLTYTEWKDNHK